MHENGGEQARIGGGGPSWKTVSSENRAMSRREPGEKGRKGVYQGGNSMGKQWKGEQQVGRMRDSQRERTGGKPTQENH